MSQSNLNNNYYKKIIVALVLGWVAIWIYRTILTPIYPQLQEALGDVSQSQIGLIASCYFFAYTGMQIPSGFLVDKFGQKTVLIPAFIGFALATFIIGTSTGILQVYLGAILAGISTGCYYGSAFSLSAKHVPQHFKSTANAIINSGSALGMVIGLIGSSVLVGALDIQWNFMLYGAGILILAVTAVFFLLIKSDKNDGETVDEVTTASVIEEDTNVAVKLFTATHLVTYFTYFAVCYGYYMIVTWLPAFLVDEKGFDQGSVGYVAAIVAVTAIPGALFFSRFVDKNPGKRNMTIVMLLLAAAITIGLTVFSPNPWVLYVALVLYGFLGKLAIDPVLITFVSDSVPQAKVAKALTIFNTFGMASSIVAPWLTGFIGDTTGSKVLGFYIGSGLLLVAVVLFFLVVATRKNQTAN